MTFGPYLGDFPALISQFSTTKKDLCRGLAWRGLVGRGVARIGKARYAVARTQFPELLHSTTRDHFFGQAGVGRGQARSRRGLDWLGGAGFGKARQGRGFLGYHQHKSRTNLRQSEVRRCQQRRGWDRNGWQWQGCGFRGYRTQESRTNRHAGAWSGPEWLGEQRRGLARHGFFIFKNARKFYGC